MLRKRRQDDSVAGDDDDQEFLDSDDQDQIVQELQAEVERQTVSVSRTTTCPIRCRANDDSEPLICIRSRTLFRFRSK